MFEHSPVIVGGLWAAGALVLGVVLALAVAMRGRTMAVGREVAERTARLDDIGRRFRTMVDHAHDLTFVVTYKGVVDYANTACSRVLGYGRDELRGMVLTGLIHPKEAPAVQAMLDDVLGGKVVKPLTFRMKPRGQDTKKWVWVDATARGLPDAEWMVRQVVVQAHDITAHREAQAELAQNERRFRDFAGSSADWLWEVDADGLFTYVSPGVTGVLGYDAQGLLGTSQLVVLFGDAEDAAPARDLIASRMERAEAYRDLEFWTQGKMGERVCLRLSGVPVMDDDGFMVGYRGAASNVTASKLDRENMYRMATSDQLTGLLNRGRFKEELERAVALSRRHGTKGVMMFIDLDRFKEVNDTHGHEAGDRILQEVASILRGQMRSTDVLARLGGDEFGILMHNIDLKTAEQKVQGVIEQVKAMTLEYNGAKLTTTMSMGMVQYPQDEKGVDHLIMSADLAMYRAKDMGRNRLFVDGENETSEAAGSVRAQLKWMERLKTCLETGDFQMHYQAIVPDSPRKKPLFEALLRIYDEEGKVVSPALYIDAAEHFGLIQQLDLAVTKRVFETQRALMKEKVMADVSINLSCRSLGDPVVMERLKLLMKETEVDPTHIVFEVTETMALHDPAEMRDIDDIKAFIDELRAMGFRFALDDFGSGFTSFKYLRVLEVDIVKIDGEFVKNIVSNAEDQLFVKSMVGLCQGMGIETIAEFVEDAPCRDKLVEIGVEYGQGWLFAKPEADLKALVGRYAGKVMGDFPVVAKGEVKALKQPSRKAKVG